MSALTREDHSSANLADDPDRRIAPRMKVLKRAQVLFNNNFSTFDCIVRNISATGALLTLDDAVHLPKEFGVRIGEDKTVRPARLVYRRGALAGIRFLDYVEEEEELKLPAAQPAGETVRQPEGSIQKIAAEPLPSVLRRHFRWSPTL